MYVKCILQYVKGVLQDVKCDLKYGECDLQCGMCVRELDLLLDGLIIYNEFLRIYFNRINYCKCYEREEFEFNELSGCEIKCLGVQIY